jgi:hypothetical protein
MWRLYVSLGRSIADSMQGYGESQTKVLLDGSVLSQLLEILVYVLQPQPPEAELLQMLSVSW